MSSLAGLLHCTCRHLRSGLPRPTKRRRLSSVSSAVAAPPFRVLVFGADEFSCATLRALHEYREDLVSELVVVVPPDARTGRGLRKMHRPPLRLLAEELGLETLPLPPTLLKGWQPPPLFLNPSSSNILLTASFGHLIPTSLLSLFEPLNTLNVHPSLLPLYRGAAPIQWALANGEERTGVSVQELSRGKFDQGRLLGQRVVDIPSRSTFATLEPILAKEGGDLLVHILKNLPEAQATAQPQDSAMATLAPKLTKETSRIPWASKSASELINMQRGFGHHIPLWTMLASGPGEIEPIPLQIHLFDTSLADKPPIFPHTDEAPGTVELHSETRRLFVHCGKGEAAAIIYQVKAPNGKWVKGRDWWNGAGKAARSGGPMLRFD